MSGPRRDDRGAGGSHERPAATTAQPDMSAFGYDEITALLPHRYPFLFLDRIVEFEDGARIVALKNVTTNEPFFRGHFPEQPVMPGVLICETMAQAAAFLAHRSTKGVPPGHAVLLTGMDNVRFRKPVLPGHQLFIEVVFTKQHRPLWKFHGVARVDGQVMAEADLSAMEIARSRRP